MAHKSLPLLRLSLPLLVALSGCEGAPDAQAVSEISSAASAVNGITLNGITLNGITLNGITLNGITLNGLVLNGIALNGIALNGIALNGIALNGLADPTVHTFASYLVGCALPEGETVSYRIDGTEYTFGGDLGLAPEWKWHACGEHCQRWVSACLLARVNKKGEHVQISMRGENPGLALEPRELQDYQMVEGAYYGNLFAPRHPAYACYPSRTPALVRVCGESLADCPMQVVGPCEQACKGASRREGYRDCATSNDPRRNDDPLSEVITVFLR
jgi:hypothetical protein